MHTEYVKSLGLLDAAKASRWLLLLGLLLGCGSVPSQSARYHPGLRFHYDEHNYLNYRFVGVGSKTLLMFHGYGSSGHNWDDLLALLKLNDYRLLIFDLIGSGHSSKPVDQDYSIVANAEIIARFLSEKNIQDYVLLGQSFGGGVALATTLLADKQGLAPPRALLLSATMSYPSKLPLFVTFARVPLLSKISLRLFSAQFIAKLSLRRVFHQRSKIRQDQIDRYTYFMAQDGFADAVTQLARDIVPPNIDELTAGYATIDVPTLVVWGAEDKILPLSLGRRLVSEMPNAQLRVLESCGHNIQEECPELLASAIENFFSAH